MVKDKIYMVFLTYHFQVQGHEHHVSDLKVALTSSLLGV